ncbi:MAG: 50S ribosomal protein L13 [Candidatus Pacearchaeota archaeon]
MKEIIIDAAGSALGRFSTFAAKQALLGNKVIIINCNKAVITGKKHAVLEAYQKKLARGGFSQKGPYISKIPEKIVKRTIRGMLPWNIARGRKAFKLIKCFNESPEQYAKSEKIIKFPKANPPFITLEILKELL